MRIILWLLGLLLPTACTKIAEDPVAPHIKYDPVCVELTLKAEEQRTVTRRIDENVLRDVNLYLYGPTDYHFFFPTVESSMAFEVVPGDYDAYILANSGRDMGPLDKELLTEMRIAAADMYQMEQIPMTTRVPLAVNASVNASPQKITVRRCAAKINYDVRVDDAVASYIRLRSVQFCNVPRFMQPFASNERVSLDSNNFGNGEEVICTDTRAHSGEQYLFENLRGQVETITDQKDKSPKNAPECATYMRILAERSMDGALIEYIVYLGENNTSDFNVRRNTKHTLNLIIRGENEIDNRVKVFEGLYYGTANCHICTGKQVTFDVRPYRTTKKLNYPYTGVYAGAEYKAVAAQMLWEDVKGLVTGITLKKDLLTVVTNGSTGNALIGIYDENVNLLWSFHIWCTEQPGLIHFDSSTKNPNNNYVMMDRDLGAHELGKWGNYVDNTGTGLVYQFGRKDPFPSWDYELLRASPIYDSSGKDYIMNFDKIVMRDKEDAQFGYCGTIAYATAHPMIYIGTYDNWSSGWVYPFDFHSIANLWGNPLYDSSNIYPDTSAIPKTVYDPCPEGYKVSPNDGFAQIDGTSYRDAGGVIQKFYSARTGGYSNSGSIYNGTVSASVGVWGSGCSLLGNGTFRIYKLGYGLPGHPCESGAVRCVKE